MNSLQNFINRKFKNFPNTEEVVSLKNELLGNLQDKVNHLVTSGHSEKKALAKVINDFGDINELITESGLHNEIFVYKLSCKLSIWAIVFQILYCLLVFLQVMTNLKIKNSVVEFHLILNNLYHTFKLKYLFFNINDILTIDQRINISIIGLIITCLVLIISLIGYIFKLPQRYYKYVLVVIGMLSLIYGSYYSGVLLLLAGLIYLTKNFIIISLIGVSINLFLIVNYLPYFLANMPFIDNVILAIYVLLSICFIIALYKNKLAKSFWEFSLYMMIFVHILYNGIFNHYFLIIGLPLLIIMILLKVRKITHYQ
jgi:hypothetical protein